MDTRPIGMFDSGVGGLTVLREIRKSMPKEDIIYLGDTKRFPYGPKSTQTIIEASKKCAKFLEQKHVKLIIIACGTATSQALDELKKAAKVPVIGIISPTIEYLKDCVKESQTIGVIATEGTIKSRAWEINIKENMQNIEVINKATPMLATIAEQGWINNKVAKDAIKEYMKKLKSIDKLILGCTHYSLFKDLIENELGQNVEIINTGEKLAYYLKQYLKENRMQNEDEKNTKYEIFLTDTETDFKNVASKLIDDKSIIDTIRKADI